MPRFPKTDDMTREERFTVVAIYLAKVVDHLQGVEDEYTYPIRRPHLDRTPGGRLPTNLKIQDLLLDFEKEDPTPKTGEECEDTGVGPDNLAEPEG